MARESNARNKSEVGETREAKIAAMLAAGLGRAAIQNALETEYTETMPKDDSRRKAMKSAKPFDATARQRMLEAIRSTARLMRMEEEDIDALTKDHNGDAPIQSVAATELSNQRRWATGEGAIDWMYGDSKFIWLKDQNDKHPEKGLYRAGDYMPHWIPVSVAHRGWIEPTDEKEIKRAAEMAGADPNILTGKYPTKDEPNTCYMEEGLPDSWLSIFAGSPGVGKSRLAIKLAKQMNAQERLRAAALKGYRPRPVLYYNGEAEKSQFRQWCGHDVDEELFLVHHGELIRTERVVADTFQHRPWVVIVDSFQMLGEVEKGIQGTMRALARFKLLKNDVAAGKPHIIFISQLNKKGEMSGSRKIPHMVDTVAHVTKYERGKGCFMVECPEKNRGGESGRGGIYRHTDQGIECLSRNHRQGPTFDLKQDLATRLAAATPETARNTPPETAPTPDGNGEDAAE